MDNFGDTLEVTAFFINVIVFNLQIPKHISSVSFPHIHRYTCLKQQVFRVCSSLLYFFPLQQVYVYDRLNSAHLSLDYNAIISRIFPNINNRVAASRDRVGTLLLTSN